MCVRLYVIQEFRRMEHVGEKLRLSQGVIDRAQFYFSQYRDNREKLHQVGFWFRRITILILLAVIACTI